VKVKTNHPVVSRRS